MNNEEISDSQDNDLSQVLNELSELREQTQSSLDKFTRLRPFIENEAEYRYPKSEEAKAAEQKLHKMMPLAPMPPDVSGLERGEIRQNTWEFLERAQQFLHDAGYYSQPPPSEMQRQSEDILKQFVRLTRQIKELSQSLNGEWIDPNR